MTDLFYRSLLKCGQEISVLERSLVESSYDSMQPVENFIEIDIPLSIVKTIDGKGSKLFDSVNIVEDATHIFCVVYTSGLAAVEGQNYFIELKNKRFKVLEITNVDEKDTVLIFQCTNRGLSSQEATEA